MAKADWSNFDQSNDYSFNDADKIVVLMNDTIVSGTPPIAPLKVTYGNFIGKGLFAEYNFADSLFCL